MKIPVSLLSNFEYCPRKVFMERILKVYAPSPEGAVLGSIRHETFDSINKSEEAIVKSIKRETSFEEIEEILKKEFGSILRKRVRHHKERLKELGLSLPNVFKGSWPSIMNEAVDRAKNIYEFMEKRMVFGDELWQSLTPKIKSEIPVESADLKLRGIVDQIRYYDRQMIPLELKTGEAPSTGVWPSHRVQIGAYIMILASQNNMELDKGYIKYIDSASMRKVKLNPFLKHEVKSTRDKVISLLNSRKLPARIANLNKCAACILKETCYDDTKMEKLINAFNEKGKL